MTRPAPQDPDRPLGIQGDRQWVQPRLRAHGLHRQRSRLPSVQQSGQTWPPHAQCVPQQRPAHAVPVITARTPRAKKLIMSGLVAVQAFFLSWVIWSALGASSTDTTSGALPRTSTVIVLWLLVNVVLALGYVVRYKHPRS